jgi:hypothetical protein
VSVLVITATIAASSTSARAQREPGHRVASWGPSMTTGGPTFNDQTIRMVVHTSIGGMSPRIKLSNLRSTSPLAVGAVDVAEQASGATAVPGTHHTVTFSHAKAVTIPTGAEVLSDPVHMTVGAEQNLLVSIDLPQATTSATWHSDAFDTTYVTPRMSPCRATTRVTTATATTPPRRHPGTTCPVSS